MTDNTIATGPLRGHSRVNALIGIWGLYQMIVGLYFIFLRPSLLPEDLRAAATTIGALQGAAPSLESWLHRVFWVLGGQMAATGALLCGAALRLGRNNRPTKIEMLAYVVAGLFSVVLMSGVNFALNSDFRWLLVAQVLLWLSAMVVLGRGAFIPARSTLHE